MTTILMVAAVIVIAAWLLRMRRPSADDAAGADTPRARSDSRYHAVSIKHDGKPCTAAQNLAGQRFLAADAPQLPLPDCDADDCHCRFVHHDDRRTGRDRRSPFAPSGRAGSTGEYLQEQRSGRDRRRNEGD